jgi:hypothetical protein
MARPSRRLLPLAALLWAAAAGGQSFFNVEREREPAPVPADADYFTGKERGWFWYEREPEPEQQMMHDGVRKRFPNPAVARWVSP